MTFCQSLNAVLENFHLLKHCYYQAWAQGQLSLNNLKNYSKEYYPHVASFPRYISQIHSLCPDIKARQILLENLIDEEQGENNHPELWLRFAQGLGVTREEIQNSEHTTAGSVLAKGYFDLVKTDYATGLGALYAYERQTPDVATSKIEGLKKHYGITEASTLEFFKVHQQADEWHTAELVGLIEKLQDEDQAKVAFGAQQGAKLLWGFLDKMMAFN